MTTPVVVGTIFTPGAAKIKNRLNYLFNTQQNMPIQCLISDISYLLESHFPEMCWQLLLADKMAGIPSGIKIKTNHHVVAVLV